MTVLRIPIPSDADLDEYGHEELLEALGEIDRVRYKLADVEKRLMDELDERESSK